MRLRRSVLSAAGITRVRRGRGFSYRDTDGNPVGEGDSARIRALAIPPAWVDVWICPLAHGHIQATGVDGAGRRQYLYHAGWHERMAREKYERMLQLAAVLPAARRGVTRNLRHEGFGRERVLAGAFRMLDTGSLRVGSERYARQHGSMGLSTLLCSHATVHGQPAVNGRSREGARRGRMPASVELRFPGKSGQAWESTLEDPDLVALVAGLKRRGGRARLLAWRDESGTWHPVSAEEINAEVRRWVGEGFTAKDFRTLHGTVAAAESLARSGVAGSQRTRQRAIAEATRSAAAVLGNTPAVARASYIDPRLLDAYERGEMITLRSRRSTAAQIVELLAER